MRRRLKRVDRLAYELCGITELAHDGQLVRLDARDVHEITDDPAHLATEPLDAVRIADDLRDRRVRRRELVDEVGAERDPSEQRPQVVAHHGHEVLAGGQRLIGTRALELEPQVGILALVREQTDERELPPPARGHGVLIRLAALRHDHGVLVGALLLERIRGLRDHAVLGELAVLALARVAQHRVRLLPRLRDQIVASRFDRAERPRELSVGLAALGAEALIRRMTLGRLPFVVRHAPRTLHDLEDS